MSETFFLAAACKAGRAPWQVSIEDDLTTSEMPQTDVVVLANYGSLNREHVANLEKAVEKGMGLVIFVGELIDPLQYNELLYKNGMGLLPAKLQETVESEFQGLEVESVGASPLDSLSKLAPSVLKRVRPSQAIKIDPSTQDNDQVRVLAYWGGDERIPALLEKRFGSGRVYLWTVTADRTWCNWQTEPSFVLSARQTMVYAATQSSELRNLFSGQTITKPFSLAERPGDLIVEGPQIEKAEALSLESDETKSVTKFSETNVAGFYRVSWKAEDDQVQFDDYGVNPDPRESDSERLDEEAVINLVGDVQTRVISSGNLADGSVPKTELWRKGAWIFLALIGCESLLAAWIGRER